MPAATPIRTRAPKNASHDAPKRKRSEERITKTLLSRSTVFRPNSRHSCVAAAQPSKPPTLKPLTIDDHPVELTGVPDAARLSGTISSRLFSCRRERKHGQTRRDGVRGLELCVDWSCAWRTTPVAKPDWIEEPSVTTATVTMSRSFRALGGSMAASRRGVVLVVRASVTSITRGFRAARPLGEREGEISDKCD